MTEEELATIMGSPFQDMFNISKNRELFRLLLSLAIEKGKTIGLNEGHTLTNQAFHKYKEKAQ